MAEGYKEMFEKELVLGMGTNRFRVQGSEDERGIQQASDVMKRAMEQGISYVDMAPSYSKGTAAGICRQGLNKSQRERYVTVKSSFLTDKTARDAMRRIEENFRLLDVSHMAYFVCWNIADWNQFQQIMKKGGLYEGAQKAKERHMIDHICFSSHASPEDMMRMIQTGAFEAVTLSLSPMNSRIMRPVLDCALKYKTDVIVMNPLGGGMIPQNPEYFSFLRQTEKETVVQAALRFAGDHPAVRVVLSGISDQKELEENLAVFSGGSLKSRFQRTERVEAHFSGMEGFCTGCRYCEGCPAEIDVFAMMQAYNTTFFPDAGNSYGEKGRQCGKDLEICKRLKNTFDLRPVSERNPCIRCGKCEERCTAHLPIINRIGEMYQMFEARCFSREGMKKRLLNRIGEAKRVAFYPGGGYTAYALELLKEAAEDQEAYQISVFDSSPALWGSRINGIKIRNPKEIPDCEAEVIVISNYIHQEAIFSELKKFQENGIRIETLHRPGEIPWVF